ncbi:MAG: hypothetical protein NTNFB02_26670 [Nitrospira sp.]
MPQSDINVWLQFALQQMAAESYLGGIDLNNAEQVKTQLRLGNNPSGFPETGTTRFTGTITQGLQAQSFVEHFQILDHHANDATGFSATLMRERDTNNFTLSFRSTESRNQRDGGDYERDGVNLPLFTGADGEILTQGFAFGQLTAMEQYYQTTVKGLLPVGAVLNVTGYSLGAHLATVFTELHGLEITSSFSFGHAYTFNGPGRGEFSGGPQAETVEAERIREMVARLTQVMNDPMAGIPQGTPEELWPSGLNAALVAWQLNPTWDPWESESVISVYTDSRYLWAKQVVEEEFSPVSRSLSDIPRTDGAFGLITQIVGHATQDDTEYVANSGNHAPEVRVYIEDQPNFDGFGNFFETNGSFGTTHSITLIVDSLATQELFQTIAPALAQSDIEAIFAASSNDLATGTTAGLSGSAEAKPLENALDALRRLFLTGVITETPANPATGGFGDLTNRNKFYEGIGAVKTALAGATVTIEPFVEMGLVDGQPKVLPRLTPVEVIVEAQHNTDRGLAFRYALRELNPFAVVGADYQGLGHTFDGRLALFDPAIGFGEMTEEYLADRAGFLEAKIEINLLNNTTSGDTIHYVDVATGYEIKTGTIASIDREYLFGADKTDIFVGNSADDHLFGGAGSDVLFGSGGNDYLQGDTGNDRLDGTIGSDTLNGGAGFDTYVLQLDGTDRIEDSDRCGVIQVGGQLVLGGVHRGGDPAGTYTSPDGQFSFVETGGNLTINGHLTISNWQAGTLGVMLRDLSLLPSGTSLAIDYNNGQPTVIYDGDATDNTPIFNAAANHIVRGFGGNDVLDLSPSGSAFNHQLFGGDGHDELHGGAGSNRLFGEDGRDLMFGGFGDDVMDGGSDIDLLKGGAGRDALYGKGGSDGLDGGSGDDVLFGGDDNDVLSGESIGLGASTTGNDYLDGEAGADWLMGLLGNDVLQGGAGNDHLYGDQAPAEAPNFDLTYPGLVTSLTEVVFTSFAGGTDYLDGGAGDDYLQGDGGNDVLLGGTENDTLYGDDSTVMVQQGNDWLDGGSGNDNLYGGGGDDTLDGGADNDLLVGDFTDDPIGGADWIDGGDGDDTLIGGQGEDVLFGGPDQDVLFGNEGQDALDGGSGNDELQGGIEADVLWGGTEDDRLFGEEGDDQLFGGEGNDGLFGEAGADLLVGAGGADTLRGGEGPDTYVFNLGDGIDTIVDGPREGNRVVFGPGISADDISLGIGSLLVRVGANGDAIHIQGFDPADPTQSAGIDQFEFADGTILTHGELVARGFDLVGTNGDDFLDGGETYRKIFGLDGNDQLIGGLGDNVLDGGAGADHLFAGAGADRLLGGTGNDWLDGGEEADTLDGGLGNDRLEGGSGDDTYRFSLGSGFDQIVESSGTGDSNLVVFGTGIEPAGVQYRLGNALELPLGTQGDGLSLGSPNFSDVYNSRAIDQFQFADGTVLTHARLVDRGINVPGTEDNDSLDGTNARDLFAGGRGNDRMNGAAGDDQYTFAVGDGIDTIEDLTRTGQGNGVVFGSGITSADLSLGWQAPPFGNGTNKLLVRVGTSGDALLLDSFDRNDVLGIRAVDSYRFSDGSALMYHQLVARGFDLTGAEGNDVVAGTNVTDRLKGLAGQDRLQGGDGDDVLDGGTGNDLLNGGRGADTYVLGRESGEDHLVDVGGMQDTIQYAADVAPGDVQVTKHGNDVVLTIDGTGNGVILSQFFTAAVLQVDTVRFADGTVWDAAALAGFAQRPIVGTTAADILTGTAGDDLFQGLAGNDQLSGLAGNDVLDGGTGADTMTGGPGDDIYVVDDGADIVTEAAGEGLDTVQSSVSHQLSAQVENLTLVGAVAIDGTGNALDNILIGNSAANALTGRAGNDTYTIDGDDVVVERPDEGVDTVQIDHSYALGANLESLTLTGSAPIDGTGNDLDNVLTGNSAVNVLTGGKGNDTYVVSAGDIVVEQVGEGIDTIQTTRSYRLGTNVENLTLLETARNIDPFLQLGPNADEAIATSIYGGTGAGLQVGIGNALDNVLLGNGQRNVLEAGVGNDTLAGNGGLDVLRGGSGQDTYLFGFGSGIDVIDDVSTGEIDTIQLEAGISPDQVMVTRQQILTESPIYSLYPFAFALSLALPNPDRNAGAPADQMYIVYSSLADFSTKQVRFADGTVWDGATLLEKSAGEPDPGPGITLDGGIDDDLLIGTEANDRLNGFAGNDRLEGGAGSDILDGGSGNDVLLGGDGRDALSGGEGDNELDGGAGDDSLSAIGGQNVLRGGAGNDSVSGQGLTNLLDGGVGNDNLFGLGTDTFVFGRGYGYDSANPGSEDIVQMTSDVLPVDVMLYSIESGNHRLGIHGSFDELQMGSSFPGQVVFADGTVWDQAYLMNHEQQGMGTDGNDTMGGASGADILVGGKGDDLYGVEAGDIVIEFQDEGNDTITTLLEYALPDNVENLIFNLNSHAVLGIGNDLDNVIEGSPDHGGDGDNILDGGAGNDVLIGGASIPSFTQLGDGSDLLIGGPGNDVLRPFFLMLGGPFFNSLESHGIDLLLGGPGDDTYILIGGYTIQSPLEPTIGPFFDLPNATVVELPGEGSDTLVAITDQTLPSNVENLFLFGGTHGIGNELDNVLIGGIGANILEGHTGNDTLIGGYGRILSPNGIEFVDSATVLDDSINDTAIDTLIGGVGDDVYVVGVGDIIVESTGEGADRVISRASYQLGDHLEHLILAGDESIDGTGNGLDNRLTGNGAVNVLAGGLSDDVLLGNGGDDTYVFNIGDGADTIEDTASTTEGNRIRFGAGITQSDLTFTRDDVAHTLTIRVGGSGIDQLLLTNFDPTATHGSLVVDTLAFADGTSINLDSLLASMINQAPTVAQPLADWTVPEDIPFSFVVPANTFADPNAGDHLTLSASLADGGALPTWLSFDASTRTFSGTPANGDVGSLEVKVTATDSGTLSVSDTFNLTATNVNDAPTVANPIVDQSAQTGAVFSFTLPANTFSDIDVGDTLIYTATLAEGGALPAWLNFNTATRTFSGTPANGDVGSLEVKVTATDSGSLSVADDFTLTVSTADQTLTGTAGNDVLTGGVGNDQLFGRAGNDTLVGGAGNDLLDGGAGVDNMRGGLGNDTYVVDNAGDVVTENTNEGIDSVQSSITYTIGANVEHLTLTGAANINGTGNALDNILVGNSGNNTLAGGAGNDRLDGGLGNDTMIGGTGNDTFVVNQAGDVVTESSNQGIDTVESAVTCNLGSNVENLTLTGTTDINGTGSSANNVLLGNSGNNQLEGGSGNDQVDGGHGNDLLQGGSGEDSLAGGLGDDMLTGGSDNDVLDGGDGFDTLDGGSGNDILRGGAGNDSLSGGSGADQFTGGTGNDTLTGGSGNDSYTFVRGDGQEAIVDSDSASGNQDHVLFGQGINPLDLVLSRQVNNLRLAVHGSNDVVTIRNWYTSPATNQIENIQAGNGQHLLNTQVDQLIQAMAGFSQQSGLTWDQAIDQQPQQVQAVLAANWH